MKGKFGSLGWDESALKDILPKFDVTGVNGQAITNAKIPLCNVGTSTKGGDFYRVVMIHGRKEP